MTGARQVLNKPNPGHTLVTVTRRGATPAQLEALYRERFEHFVRVAAAVCGDGELGRDAVQAAFTIAVRERRSFRGSGTLAAWVWRIVVNEARHAAREPLAGASEAREEPTVNGDYDDHDDPLRVRKWIATLPPRQREALFLRYYADLDYATIAAVLGIEVGTVSATLAAAHRALRGKLEEVQR